MTDINITETVTRIYVQESIDRTVAVDGIYGSTRVAAMFKDVVNGEDSLDLAWIGDSNTGYNGYGWCDGFAAALTNAGARMYATSAYTAGNNYGEAGYRSQQWTFMGWVGSPGSGGYSALSASSASATLKATMGQGGGLLTIDSSVYEGGAISASNTYQNDWAIWIYARGPDEKFTLPCPIGIDNELHWRGQVNIGSGGQVKPKWLTLANASLSTEDTFNTVSASADAWDILEHTLPAGNRLATLTAAGTGIKIAIAGSGVGDLTQLTGPIRFGLHSVYTDRIGYSSSILEWRGGATLTQLSGDITQAATNATAVQNFLKYLRDRQIAAGGSGRVVVCVQGGVNSGDWSPSNPSAAVASVNLILDEIRDVWNALGYADEDLGFLVMCSHPTNSGDAALTVLRTAMRTEYTNSEDVLFVDLNALADFTRITQERWYDSGGNFHLEELRLGYEAIASAAVSRIVQVI